MYREWILEAAGSDFRGEIRSPATPAEIAAAEAEAGFPFPAELRALLSELNGDGWLFFSTDEIMETAEVNREELSDCYEGIGEHIFFAGNGCGDCYCYNLNPDGSVNPDTIYFWEHETNETHPVAASLEELIRRYYNDEI